MDKKELFDAFDGFSQNLMITLAEIEAMKKQVQSLLEENTALRLENDKLRTRLSQLEQEAPVKSSNKVRNILKVFTMMVSIFVMTITDNVVKMTKNACSVWKS